MNQMTYLSSTEEYLRMAKSIFILIRNEILHNVSTCNSLIIAALAQFTQ